MELEKIEFYNNKIHLVIDDPENQVCYSIELEAGEFFDKLASAFYSAQAIQSNPEEKVDE